MKQLVGLLFVFLFCGCEYSQEDLDNYCDFMEVVDPSSDDEDMSIEEMLINLYSDYVEGDYELVSSAVIYNQSNALIFPDDENGCLNRAIGHLHLDREWNFSFDVVANSICEDEELVFEYTLSGEFGLNDETIFVLTEDNEIFYFDFFIEIESEVVRLNLIPQYEPNYFSENDGFIYLAFETEK